MFHELRMCPAAITCINIAAGRKSYRRGRAGPVLKKERAMKRDLLRLTAVLLTAAPLLASTALAGEQFTAPDAHQRTSALALVVFLDADGSADILRGNYQDGLDKASAALDSRPSRRNLELTTNMCAAQVKLGRLEAANTNCEAALADKKPAGSVMAPRKRLAVAHVNHGVVHFVQGDYEFAEKEFRLARSMYPSLGVAASNLALARQPGLKPRVEVGETL